MEKSMKIWFFDGIGVAIYQKEDGMYKISRHDHTPRRVHLGDLHLHIETQKKHEDYRFLESELSISDILEILRIEYEKHTTLESFVDGLDAKLDEQLRCEMIDDVDETINKLESVFSFVVENMMKIELPSECDFDFAIKMSKSPKLNSLYLLFKDYVVDKGK